jgi:hypothetical protein
MRGRRAMVKQKSRKQKAEIHFSFPDFYFQLFS